MEGEESASADRGSDLMSPNEDMPTTWVGLTTVKLTANVGETNYRPTVLAYSTDLIVWQQRVQQRFISVGTYALSIPRH